MRKAQSTRHHGGCFVFALPENTGMKPHHVVDFLSDERCLPMRILSVNSCLDAALRYCGHEVFSVRVPGGLCALRQVDGVDAFAPDLLFQQESLGNPLVVTDLPSFSCAKAFWSIDTHINLHWHRYYGRLFDLFLTPHRAFCAEAPAHWQHPSLCRLAYVGTQHPWNDHATRTDSLNFVGRITEQRLFRKHFLSFLQQRYAVQARDGLSRQAMLNMYADTRILPNESIAFETNFRLLEGASCGCCVISPDIGEDQDTLFEPAREILIYKDALECMDLIDFCLRKPRMAENIGKLAHQRVQAEHLSVHRAVQLLHAVQQAPAVALTGTQAGEALWCSVAELELTGAFVSEAGHSLWENDVYGSPTTMALRVRWAVRQHHAAQRDALLHRALDVLSQTPLVRDGAGGTAATANDTALRAEAATVIGLTCLQQGDSILAAKYWQAFLRCSAGDFSSSPDVGPRDASGPIAGPPSGTAGSACDCGREHSAEAVALALEWAARLYPAAGHWYQALEMLSFVSRKDPLNSAWAEAWVKLTPMVRHFPLLALSARARLSLNVPDDPYLCAAYVAENVRCFRLHEAREELEAFLDKSAGSPEEAVLWRVLRTQCKNISKLTEALQPFSSFSA